MRRVFIIILCLLCMVIINSCTGNTDKQSSTSNQPTTEESTTSEATAPEQTPTESTAPEAQNSTEQIDSNRIYTEEEVPANVGGVEKVETLDVEAKHDPVGTNDAKQITITVVDGSGQRKDQTIQTQAGDLMTALEESGLGSDSENIPGYIQTVDGITADTNHFQWWEITKNNEAISSPADQTAITNGEHYTFTLKTSGA